MRCHLKEIIEQLLQFEEDARSKISDAEEKRIKENAAVDERLKKYREKARQKTEKAISEYKNTIQKEETEHLQKLARNTDVEISMLQNRYDNVKEDIYQKVLRIILPKLE
jgi:vacuolar-type H+-ATPase subunit H